MGTWTKNVCFAAVSLQVCPTLCDIKKNHRGWKLYERNARRFFQKAGNIHLFGIPVWAHCMWCFISLIHDLHCIIYSVSILYFHIFPHDISIYSPIIIFHISIEITRHIAVPYISPSIGHIAGRATKPRHASWKGPEPRARRTGPWQQSASPLWH